MKLDTIDGRNDRPFAFLVILVGIAVEMADFAIRLVGRVVEGSAGSTSPRTWVVIASAGALGAALFGLATVSYLRGWSGAPVLGTVIGLWSINELVSYADPLAAVSVIAGVALLVASWLPSPRAYGHHLRRARLERQTRGLEATTPG